MKPTRPSPEPFRCPYCGADLTHAGPTGAAAVQTCPYCRAVVVRGAPPGPTGGRGASPPAGQPQVRALLCQLCGAPLPEAATRADPRNVRCEYCGHRARFPAGILAVLRVAFTRPRALPPLLRRTLLVWAALWALGLFVALPLTLWRTSQSERLVIDLQGGSPPTPVERSFQVPSHLQEYGRGTVRWSARPTGDAPAPICVAVRVRRADRAVQDSCVLRTARDRCDDGFDVGPGDYEVTVQASSGAPAAVQVRLDASGAASLGWIVATLILLWFAMALELFRFRFDRPARLRMYVARAVGVGWLLLLLAVAAFRWDPLAEKVDLGPVRTMDCTAPPEASPPRTR